MNKQQIKTLVESDDKLQWWAAILFSEISELSYSAYWEDHQVCWNVTMQKIKGFERIVINRAVEIAAGKAEGIQSLEERVSILEEKLGVKS